MLAKVIDERHPLSKQICEVGFKDGDIYPLTPISEPWHTGYATPSQLQFFTYLGTGLVSWPNTERITGRYGIIHLFRPGNPNDREIGLQGIAWKTDVDALKDRCGSFLAVVAGEKVYQLGSGTFFTEQAYGLTYIGLKPDNPREDDWLNTDRNLYRIDGMITRHDVDLYFVED